jgi:hypothetical protein
MKTSKIILVWFGVSCLNLGLTHGVQLVGWLFRLSTGLRAA